MRESVYGGVSIKVSLYKVKLGFMSFFYSHFHPSHHQPCLLAKEVGRNKGFSINWKQYWRHQECYTYNILGESVLMGDPRQAHQSTELAGGMYFLGSNI